MQSGRIRGLIFALLLTTCLFAWGQEKRKIIIDQDAAGPAGTDLQSTLPLNPVSANRGVGHNCRDRRCMAESGGRSYVANARTHRPY